jgi:hypothetical protein
MSSPLSSPLSAAEAPVVVVVATASTIIDVITRSVHADQYLFRKLILKFERGAETERRKKDGVLFYRY